jgi:hypothetical protein
MPRSRTPGGAYETARWKACGLYHTHPWRGLEGGPTVGSAHLPCGWERRDALHVAPPVLLDVDDLKVVPIL